MDYRRNRQRGGDGLLHQDRAVMDLLLRGKTRDEICAELGMPLGTVNTCCTRLYKRFGCKNVAEFIITQGPGGAVRREGNET